MHDQTRPLSVDHNPEPYVPEDHAALLADIKRTVAERRARGDLPEDAELDRLEARVWAEVAPTVPADPAPLNAAFIEPAPPAVSFTLAECEVLPTDYTIDWQRPVVGQAHAALRRQINAEVRRYVDPPLARQTRLNYRLTDLLQRIVRDHEIGLASLRKDVTRAGGLRMELDALREEMGMALAEVQRLRVEAATLQDEVGLLRSGLQQLSRATRQEVQPTDELPLDYLAYNERVGGGIAHERALYAAFVPVFADATGLVVDLGCGRGAFLELLHDTALAYLGVDRAPEMVAYARAQGHRVVEADVLTFLDSVTPGSLGGLFAAHLVEHLTRPDLIAFVARCQRALAPGAPLVLVTPNPRSLLIFSDTFYKDLTHVAPIHPDALDFLLEQAGFARRALRTLSPAPEAWQLEPEDVPGAWSPALRRNLDRVGSILFGDLDYAIVAHR